MVIHFYLETMTFNMVLWSQTPNFRAFSYHESLSASETRAHINDLLTSGNIMVLIMAFRIMMGNNVRYQ